VSERLRRARRGVRGGEGGVRGQRPRIFFFSGRHISVGTTYFRDDIFPYFRDDIFPGPHDIRWFFGTWFFADGFLFPLRN
jgi:hypothetical protein